MSDLRTIRPRWPFALWCWAMLLVVLMSAAPTSGHVRTRLIGSAFDPASVSVALNTKQTKARSVSAQRQQDGLPDEWQGRPSLPAVTTGASGLTSTAAPIRTASAPAAASVSPTYAGIFPRANGARAPPSAA